MTSGAITWRYYYPPNDWNCRCTAVQVLKGKYPTSDDKQAIQAGDRMTDTPKKRIFRFNPGIDGQLFPPKLQTEQGGGRTGQKGGRENNANRWNDGKTTGDKHCGACIQKTDYL